MTKKYFALTVLFITLASGAFLFQKSFVESISLVADAATPSAHVARGTHVQIPQPPSRSDNVARAGELPRRAQKTGAPSESTSTAQALNVTLRVEGASYGLNAEDRTVLEAMQDLASSTDFTFTFKDYPSLGAFVESINGKKNADGFYWFLYVNGKSSDTGASQTPLHQGDIVEWRFKKDY